MSTNIEPLDKKVVWYIAAYYHSLGGSLQGLGSVAATIGMPHLGHITVEIGRILRGFKGTTNLEQQCALLEQKYALLRGGVFSVQDLDSEHKLFTSFNVVDGYISKIREVIKNPEFEEKVSIERLVLGAFFEVGAQYENVRLGSIGDDKFDTSNQKCSRRNEKRRNYN